VSSDFNVIGRIPFRAGTTAFVLGLSQVRARLKEVRPEADAQWLATAATVFDRFA
jgi:hypothetical protein